ncbi:hypothetical protein G7Y89_g11909 [Cudoniella acicularis]|uniref:Pectinesterase catalytic domain-containing protein n=1 Tax=Cudoniella acicularis TaxID=354080 RepID=A0A8H4RA24_9HELO|nr:hypothetical protein G7Y89_g11909 [Cudoniella acicularis]
MRSPLASLLLLAGLSLAHQETKCVNDSCQQTFQRFGNVASAYCVLYREVQGSFDLPGFMSPWGNQPESISSACSCITSTASTTTSSSALTSSKCVATPTTVVSVSTVKATPSTVISYSTILSTVVDRSTVLSTVVGRSTVVSTQIVTIHASTVTSTSEISIPVTITDYSTVVSTRTVSIQPSTVTVHASTVVSTSELSVPVTITDYSTIVSTQTVSIQPSTVTVHASTVVSASDISIPVTITDYSTIVSTQTVSIQPSTVISASDISIPVTITDYSTVVSTRTITITSQTESYLTITTTIVVVSGSTTSASLQTSYSNSSMTGSISAISSTSGSSVQSIVPTTSSTLHSSSSTSTSKLLSSSSSTGSTPCTCTAYSQIAPAVAACTQITLQDISVPDNNSINLASLKTGSVVTFAGTTTFGFTNSSTFNPITIGGAGITILGAPGSILDGNGQAYWDGQGSNGGVPKPDHFIVLNKVTANSVIKDLYIQNYPVHCFSISSCSDFVITNIQINNTAGNAPNAISDGLAAAHNTDGFDISTTSNLLLTSSTINNQDDCVAITSGNNITVTNCIAQWHGLSIGSVGGKSNNNVTNILFTDSTIANSQNGARIKSNYNTTGFISNVTYSNIALSQISIYGIDIQQDYLNGGPTGIPSNGVIITDLNFINLTGSATASAQDYYILCGSGSCSDFTFTDVSIVGGTVANSCNYPPSGCPGSTGSATSSSSTVSSSTVGSATSSTSVSSVSSLSSSATVQSSSTSTSASSVGPSSTSVYARTSPAAGAVVVDATGATAGSYLTVQAGVNALSLTKTTPQNLFIYPGTYTEQVYIPALLSNLTVQGYTLDSSSYAGNTATVTYNLALLDTTSDDLTATIRQWNTNTKFYNLNIANTFGHVSTNGQNLALSAHTGNQGYYGIQLWGYQDTLLANTGNQLYAKSLIVGAVDFIFGQTATAWLEQVDIRTIATGCLTASGRASASNPSWYVINNSTVAGINSSIAAGINYLGRPWESFARVVFQNTDLSDVIAPAGWRPWSTAVNGTTNTENVTFAEYDNYGPGSILEEGPRASYSEQLSAPIEIETVLGNAWMDEWWVDESYMV